MCLIRSIIITLYSTKREMNIQKKSLKMQSIDFNRQFWHLLWFSFFFHTERCQRHMKRGWNSVLNIMIGNNTSITFKRSSKLPSRPLILKSLSMQVLLKQYYFRAQLEILYFAGHWSNRVIAVVCWVSHLITEKICFGNHSCKASCYKIFDRSSCIIAALNLFQSGGSFPPKWRSDIGFSLPVPK